MTRGSPDIWQEDHSSFWVVTDDDRKFTLNVWIILYAWQLNRCLGGGDGGLVTIGGGRWNFGITEKATAAFAVAAAHLLFCLT